MTDGSEGEEGHSRVPPGQRKVDGLPVLHYGDVPAIDIDSWRFRVFGEVGEAKSLTFDEFKMFPATELVADIHCVTTWSSLDTHWKGVRFKDLHELVEPAPQARYVLIHGEPDYTTGLPLEALLDEDVIFAYEYEGAPLAPERGWPVRLVVPKRYFYKSAKWVTGMEYMTEPRLGFWEKAGYSETADPWREERYG